MAIIDSAYQYYLSTYGNSAVSRYDTHKKSQLRDVYNQIVKINKESPLYKIKNTGDVKKYAIDIKESAKSLQNVISSLSDSTGSLEDAFSKKIAQSSNEDILTVEYIGEEDTSAPANGFDIQVQQLASNQVNLGNYLAPDRLDIEPGTYSFDLDTSTRSYEFQYTVNEDDTNASLLKKLAKLVNSTGNGVSATIQTDEIGQIALQLATRQTGIAENETSLFQIVPDSSAGSTKAMRTLGLNHITQEAKNSFFLLNGKAHSAFSNTFTVDNKFDVTLHSINEDEGTTRVGFKTNVDAIADNLQRLADAYNHMIDVAQSQTNLQSSNKLVRDIGGVTRNYHNELESIDADSHISIDRNLLADAVTASDAVESFDTLNRFKDSLSKKTAYAFIDPMHYVDKLVVAYKNPGHNFATPYITSIYSGMMLDEYC